MMARRLLAVAPAAALLWVLSLGALSCQASALSSTRGNLSLALKESLNSAAKTVTADFSDQVKCVVVRVTDSAGAARTSVATSDLGSPIGFSGLYPGPCEIAVEAYTSASEQTSATKVGSGSATATIVSGSTVTATATMSYDQASDSSGLLSLAISWPSSAATSVRYSIDSAYVATLTPDPVDGSCDAIIDNGGRSLTAGSHSLAITFYNGASSVVGYALETVNIWKGIKSDRWINSAGELAIKRSFSASELFDSTLGLASLSISGLRSAFAFAPAQATQSAGLVLGGSIAFTPTRLIAGQSIAYKWYSGAEPGVWVAIDSGSSSGALAVSEAASDGVNLLKIKATAANGVDSMTYSISVQKAYTLRFDLNGAESAYIDDQVVARGQSASAPAAPTRSGYGFGGWYADLAFTTAWAFGTGGSPLLADATLHAAWSRATIDVNFPDNLGLEFPTTVSILQGQPFAAETGNATLDAIASGWTWYLDGVEQTAQTGRRFVLPMAATSSMIGTYQIAASVKSGSGAGYSGRIPLTVLRRPGSWGSDTLSMDSSNAKVSSINAGVTFDTPYSLVKVGTDLYVANTYRHNIVKIDLTTGTGTVFAGSTATGQGTNDDLGTIARFKWPRSITSDGTNLYVGEEGNNHIRKIVIATAQVSTLATSGGFATNPASPYYLFGPNGIATDGTYLFATTTYSNPCTIKKVTIATGEIETMLSSSELNYILGMATDGTNLYVADRGTHVIHKVSIGNGRMTTLAGSSGNAGYADGAGGAALLNYPRDVTTDGTNVFVADSGNNMIRKIVISTGDVSTIAGSAASGTNDAVGLAASFTSPSGISTDGNFLYVADTGCALIRVIEKQ